MQDANLYDDGLGIRKLDCVLNNVLGFLPNVFRSCLGSWFLHIVYVPGPGIIYRLILLKGLTLLDQPKV